MKNENKAIM